MANGLPPHVANANQPQNKMLLPGSAWRFKQEFVKSCTNRNSSLKPDVWKVILSLPRHPIPTA